MNAARNWTTILLGLAAAAGMYTVLTKARATHSVLVLRTDVPAGTVLEAGHFEASPVRAGAKVLEATMPAADVSAVVGKRTMRSIRAGELLFRADIGHDPPRIGSDQIPLHWKTFTFNAPHDAIKTRPVSGDYVELLMRPVAGASSARYDREGPVRFVGWIPARTSQSEAARVELAVAVPPGSGLIGRLEELQVTNRLVGLELIGSGPTAQ